MAADWLGGRPAPTDEEQMEAALRAAGQAFTGREEWRKRYYASEGDEAAKARRKIQQLTAELRHFMGLATRYREALLAAGKNPPPIPTDGAALALVAAAPAAPAPEVKPAPPGGCVDSRLPREVGSDDIDDEEIRR